MICDDVAINHDVVVSRIFLGFLYDGYSPDAVTISLTRSLNNPDSVASIPNAVSTFVANLSPEPIKSLIQPSWDMNTDDLANRSLSETFMQHVTQYKAPIDKKTKRKRITPFSKLKTSKVFRESPLKEQVVDTQPIKEPVTTVDTTQSLGASESAEEQGNQLKPVIVEK
ncbi:hypothetical protein Tco_1315684 [Tanacetum coccineum]